MTRREVTKMLRNQQIKVLVSELERVAKDIEYLRDE